MSKTDQAYDALKRDILSGALLPDEPLTVATLTARYGFGWTPLRDSLSRLEGENLVTLVRNRGYRVNGASFAELRDIQHARLAIETQMLRDSIRLGDDDWQKRVLLAMQKAGDPARAHRHVVEVANAPGERIYPGELAKALQIIRDGGDVDYVGGSDVEMITTGESAGSYREFENKGGAFATVRMLTAN